MQKKPKNGRGDRHLPKAGICFEALEPRLLLSGTWGAVVDGPGADTQADAHGGLFQKSVVSQAETGFSVAGNAKVDLTPGSGRVDLLSRAPALNTLFSPIPALDVSSVSIPAAPDTEATISSSLDENKDTAPPSETLDAAVRRELVLVNDNVADFDRLINGLRESDTNRIIEIVVLDADRDGIQQVSDILADRSDLSAVHVIAHGSDGQINLGNGWLNSNTLRENSESVAGWGAALSENGDILFYGCNLAATQDGQDLTNTLAQLIKADVAASDDITGHENFGGDWELEYTAGTIETGLAINEGTKNSWTHVLAAPVAANDPTSYTNSVLDLNPLHYWRLGESSGITANDLGSATNDGTYAGSVTLGATGALTNDTDTAADFNGITDYVDVGNFNVAGSGITLTAWFNADDFGTTDQRIISKAHSSAEADHTWMLSTIQSGGEYRLRFRVDAGGTTNTLIASSGSITAGQWHHAAATYDAASKLMTLYLDGVAVGSMTHSVGGAVTPSTDNVYIAANQQGAGLYGVFDGRIDEVAVFEQALTSSEILALSLSDQVNNYVVNEDTTLTITAANGVLANDTDLDGDSLTAALNADVSNGTLTLNADGSFSYTPDADWSGTDSFTYTANDGGLDSNVATVTITVNPVNDAPTIEGLAGDSLVYTMGDGPVVIEQGGDGIVADVDSNNFDGGSLTVSITDGNYPAEDVLSIRNQGMLGGEIGFDGSNVYFGGVQIGTAAGGSTGSDLIISLNSSATANVLSALVRNITYENTDGADPTSGTRDVRYTLYDGDGGAGINYDTTVNLASVISATILDLFDVESYSNNDGTQNWSSNWIETDSQGGGATDGRIEVRGSRLDFEVASVGNNIYREADLSGGVSATLSLDYNNALGASAVLELQISGDAGANYTTVMVFDKNTNQGVGSNSIDIVDYIAADTRVRFFVTGGAIGAGNNSLSVDNVRIDYTIINFAPVAVNDTGAVDEDATLTVVAVNGVIEPNDTDVDGDTITVSAIRTGTEAGSGTAGTVGIALTGTYGRLTLSADGSYSYEADQAAADALAVGVTATDTFTYTISDGKGGSDTAELTLTITGTNDAPVAADDGVSGTEDTAISGNVLSNDTDVDGNTLIVNTPPVTGPAHGTLTLNADGSFSYTPDTDWSGTDSFTYRANDGTLDSNLAMVTITVNPIVDSVDDAATTDEDTAVTTNVLANDSFEGTPVVTSVTQGADGTVVNNGDGTVTYTPDADFNGNDSYTYTVTSGGVTETATVNVTVNPIVDSVDDAATTDEDTAVTTNVLANDSFEGTPVVTSVTQGADGTVVNNGDGTVTYTPGEDFNGSDSYTYTVTSGGVTETATVNVTVNAVVDVADDTIVTNEDTDGVINVLTNDTFGAGATVTGVTQGTSGSVAFLANGTVTYTPNTDFNGSDAFTYTVTTAAGDTETATVNVTINAVADVTDDTIVTNEDTAGTIDVLANDSFGAGATVTGVTQGTNGTVVNNGDGTVTYTPGTDFNGTDSFTYTVTTAAGDTETATVNVTVNPIVDSVDDAATTDEDTAVTTNVLANDSFEGTPVVTSVTQGADGTVVNNGDGTVTYTPDADFNGNDSYTYTVTSGGVTETATVNVTVNPIVDSVDDAATTDEDTAVTTNVLANDSFEGTPVVTSVTQGADGTVVNNGDGTVTYTPGEDFNGSDSYTYTVTSGGVTETATVRVTVNAVVDVADDTIVTNEDTDGVINVLTNDTFGAGATVTGVTQGTSGSVAFLANGTVTYTPNTDFNGSDTFTYTVTTAAGDTETATVNVTVNAVADAADDTFVTNEDTAGTIDVLANDSFGAGATVTGVTQGTNGTVVNNGDGTVTYTPGTDFNGTDSFTYTVTTAAGDTETATVNVTVNAVADVADDTIVTNEDTDGVINVLTNDTFGAGATVTGVTQGTSGSVAFLANGTVTYTPNTDFNGSDTFTYTVTTAAGDTETATVNVTVNAVADAADDTFVTNEDTAGTIDVLANDSFGAGATVTGVTQGTNGTVVNNGDGTVTYTPGTDFNGTDSFTYTVTTAAGDTETATVNVTVNPIVDSVDDAATTDEDTAVTTNVLANDSFEGTPVVTSVTQGADGTVVNNGDGTVTYTPDADFNGNDSYTYTVTSGGVTETATVDVTVNAVADVTDDTIVTNEDTDGVINVLTNDTFGAGATVTGVTQGTSGSVAFLANGTVTYTPNTDFNGSDTFTYTVTTAAGDTETATVNVTVNAVADAADDTFVTNEDTAGTIDVLANDSFGAGATVTGVTQGTNGTVVNNGDGTVTYTPDADFNGNDSYTYTVTSGGVTETATVNVTVNPIVDSVDDAATTDEDTAVTTNVLANDSFEGTPVVTSVTQGADGTVVNNGDGTVTYTPDADFNGNDSYTYTVTSGGVTETATVDVTVNAVADVTDDTIVTNEDTDGVINVLTNDTFGAGATVTGVTQGTSGSVAFLANGTVTYTPNTDFNGSDAFTYTVTTAAGDTETATVNVTINAVADVTDDTIVTNEDTAGTIDVLANDSFEGTPVVTSVTQGADGTVVNNGDGTVTYTPGEDFNGSDFYTYTVTSGGVTETATVDVTVNAVADVTDDTIVTNEDTAGVINVLTNDTFGAGAAVTGVTQGASGSVAFLADGTVTYTPNTDFNGSDTFTYTVTTAAGDTETATVNVTVNAVADAADDTFVTNEDTAGTIDVLANDSFGAGATVTGVTQGTNGTVVNNGDGTVTYTPDADFNGNDSYTYTVTSGGVTETATVNVTVNPIVDSVDDAATTDEDTAVTTNVLANDSFEGTPVVTSVTQGADGTVVNNGDGTVTYTPGEDFNGSDSYTYTVTSGGVTETATVNVTVNPIVDSVDDAATTDEDTAVTTNVLANDSFEGTPVVTSITQGANGTVVNNGDGTVTYTPDADFNGNDSYTYTVTSGGVTETATVDVTVNAVADVTDDTIVTNEDTDGVINVLTNDTFGAGATVTGVTQGTSGSVAFLANGTVTYTPNTDFNGSDTFTYTVTTAAGDTETATVNVTVNAVADAADDTIVTNEDTAGTIDVLANDSFGAGATVTGVTQGTNGTVVNNGDGTLTYTPGTDFNGTDSFTYTVTTAAGDTETATVTVTVNAVADVANDTLTTTEDTAGVLNVLINDTFGAGAAVTAVTQGDSGSVAFLADGTVTYTPNTDFNGSDTFTYTVITAAGDTETATVTVTVNAVSDDGGDSDPGPGPGVDPIEPDPEPDPDVPPNEIPPIEDELPPTEEIAISDIPSSKPPVITPRGWFEPTYFVPTISLLTTDNGLPTANNSLSGVASIFKYLQRELASRTIAKFAPDISAFFSSEVMTQDLDRIQQQIGDSLSLDDARGQLIIGAATGLSVSVFAGYVIWTLRGSSLLLSAVTAMPMWRCFDPLPILIGKDKKRRERDDAKSVKDDLDNDEIKVKEMLGEKKADRNIETLTVNEKATIGR